MPENVAANGNPDNPYGAGQRISTLTDVTITNPIISGLSASAIPDLSGTYLALSGGTVSGTLNVSTLAASTTSYTNVVAASATTTNATSTTSFATTASSTNLFAQAAQIGSLTLGNLSGFLKATAGAVSTALVNLTSDVTGVLAVSNGGTGWASVASGYLTFGNGSLALATSSGLFWDNSNSRLGVGTTSPQGRLSITSSGSTSGTAFLVANSSNSPILTVLDSGTISFAPSMTGASGGNTAVQNIVAAQPSGTVTGTYTGFRTSMGYNSASNTSGAVTGIQGVGRLYSGVANQTQGIYGIAEFDGTGINTGSLYGGRFQSQVTSTGGITHVIGVKLDGPSIASGATVDQTFGLYVQDLNAGNFGTVTGNSAAVQIEGAGPNNAIGFSGAGGSGVNSKIYSSAANQLNIEASSNLFLNSLGGNVGIGTSSPGTKLDVRGSAGALSDTSSGIAFVGTGMSKLQIGYDSTVGNGYAWLQASKNSSTWSNLILNPNGNGRIGIGTTSPETVFDVRGSGAALSNSASGIAFVGTGMSKLQIGYDTSTTRGYAWLAATKDSGTWSDLVFNPTGTGKVGVATTSPWRTLSVTGTVGFDGLTGNFGAGSLCLTANKEVVYNSGSDSCLSSLRSTKHDINALMVDAAAQVLALNPVSFIYNNDASSTVRYGFIAEDAAAVDSHLATYDQSGNLSGVDDRGLLAVIVKALQSLITKVDGFALNIVSAHISVTVGDFDTVNANKANVGELCIGATCVTEIQLKTLLANASAHADSGNTGTESASSSVAVDTTPPIVSITGANPATVNVGSTYVDFGATVTDDVDQNLGYKTFLNGTLVSDIVVDTSAAATDTIDYVATDSAGNTATSTRTVIVDAAVATSSPQ